MTPSEQIHQLTQQLRLEQERIRQAHSRMATGNGLDIADDLQQSVARREHLLEQIGLVVADAILAGHELSLEPGHDEEFAGVDEGATVQDSLSMELDSLRTVFEGMSDTSDLATMQAFDARFRSLREGVENTDRWSSCPAHAQRHLIGLAVALLRDLQEANEEFGRPLREPEIVGLVSKLSHWSKEFRPGWVNGMARGAVPEQDSWLDDAQYHADAIREILEIAD